MIRRVGIVENQEAIEVEITSTEPVAPETQVLSGPDRIVLDFPGAMPASRLKNFAVNRGGLKAVRSALFESKPLVTRVVLDLAAPTDYQLLRSGNTVIVKLNAELASRAPEISAPATPRELSPPKTQAESVPDIGFEVTRRQLALLSPNVVPPEAAAMSLMPPVEPREAMIEAQKLRDAGELDAAAKILRSQLSERPNDGEAERLLAQTVYWLKDVGGARAIYSAALVRHPDDTTLRLQYARMLAETGERARARELLTPLLTIPAVRAEAEALLGRLAYWDGDATTARRLFVEALADNPKQEEARRQLQEILADTAPWVSVSLTGGHDNQPLSRAALGVESGWFPTPLTKVSARLQPAQYWLGGSPRTVGTGELAVDHYLPRARLETELALGSVMRSQTSDAWDWTGRVALGLRLPEKFTVRGRIERTPYFATGASFNTPVMVDTAAGLIHWGAFRGWEGEAGYQQEHYPDANTIRSEYAWLLAPLLHRRSVEIKGGYAIAGSNADQSRFVLAEPNQLSSPGDPRFNLTGVYAPYYTPLHLVTHSAVAAFRLGPANGVSLQLNGSYGVWARDDAPFFFVSNGQVVANTYVRRTFPYSVHASVPFKVGRGLTLEPTGEVGRTAFYSWASAGLQLNYRFMNSAGTVQ